MDTSSLKKWATQAKPTTRPQTPVTSKGPADKGGEAGEEKGGDSANRCWEGCSAEEIGALTDADLDAFDTFLTEKLPQVRDTLLELADSIAEPNTKMRQHAETELAGQVAAESEEGGEGAGEGLTPSQVSVLADQLEQAVADEGFEAGSDELRRAALRALAMARSPDAGGDEEEPVEEEAPPRAPAAKAPPGKVPPKPVAKAAPPARPAARPAPKPVAAKKPAFGGRGV